MESVTKSELDPRINRIHSDFFDVVTDSAKTQKHKIVPINKHDTATKSPQLDKNTKSRSGVKQILVKNRIAFTTKSSSMMTSTTTARPLTVLSNPVKSTSKSTKIRQYHGKAPKRVASELDNRQNELNPEREHVPTKYAKDERREDLVTGDYTTSTSVKNGSMIVMTPAVEIVPATPPEPLLHFDKTVLAASVTSVIVVVALVFWLVFRLRKRRTLGLHHLWVSLDDTTLASYFAADDVTSGLELDEFILEPRDLDRLVSHNPFGRSFFPSMDNYSPPCSPIEPSISSSFRSMPFESTSSVTSFRSPRLSDSYSYMSVNRTQSLISQDTFFSFNSDSTFSSSVRNTPVNKNI